MKYETKTKEEIGYEDMMEEMEICYGGGVQSTAMLLMVEVVA